MPTEFISNYQIYEKVILDAVFTAKKFLWIATADIKDMYVHKGRGMAPFLEILSDFIKKGICVRLIHAKEPGPNFRKDFDKYPNVVKYLERILCPRVHFKSIIIDGKTAFTGSANLTGAGLGAKNPYKRNFEAGILTTDPDLVKPIMEQFDDLWIGNQCRSCGRKEYCADYKEIMV